MDKQEHQCRFCSADTDGFYLCIGVLDHESGGVRAADARFGAILCVRCFGTMLNRLVNAWLADEEWSRKHHAEGAAK